MSSSFWSMPPPWRGASISCRNSLLLGPPVIVAVNMIDVAESQGIRISVKSPGAGPGDSGCRDGGCKKPGNPGTHRTNARPCRRRSPLRAAPAGGGRRSPGCFPEHFGIPRAVSCFACPRNPCGYARELACHQTHGGGSRDCEDCEARVPPDVWRRIQAILLKHEDSLQCRCRRPVRLD